MSGEQPLCTMRHLEMAKLQQFKWLMYCSIIEARGRTHWRNVWQLLQSCYSTTPPPIVFWLFSWQISTAVCRAIGEYAVKSGKKEAGKFPEDFLSAVEQFDFTLFQAKREGKTPGTDADAAFRQASQAMDRWCCSHRVFNVVCLANAYEVVLWAQELKDILKPTSLLPLLLL